MQVLTSSSTAEMSTTMVWTGIASVIGAVFLGSLFDRFDGLLVISGSLFGQAVAFSTATFPSVLPGFQMIISTGFLFNFGLLTGSAVLKLICLNTNNVKLNTQISQSHFTHETTLKQPSQGTMAVSSEIWKEVAGMRAPILQATDLVHSLGIALTPLTMAPLLEHHNSTPIEINSTTSTLGGISKLQGKFNVFFWHEDDGKAQKSEWFSRLQPVQKAYLTTGFFDAVVAVVCFVVFVAEKVQKSYWTYEEKKNRLKRIRHYSVANHKPEGKEESLRLRKTSDILFCKKSHGDYISERRKRRKTNRRDLEGDVILEVEIGCERVDFKSRKAVLRDSFTRELSMRRDSLRGKQKAVNVPEQPPKHVAKVQTPLVSPLEEDSPEFECSWQLVLFALVVMLFFTTNGGRDCMLLGLLYTYTSTYLGWSALQGAGLVTTYHFTRTIVHLVFVFLVHRVSSVLINVFNVVVLLTSSVLMLATSNLSYVALTYVCVIATAIATSNVHPTAITFVQSNIQVSGKIMGVLYGAMSAGQIIYAPLLGLSLQYQGAIAFPFFLFITALFSALLFACSVLSSRSVKKYFHQKQLKKLENKRRKNEKFFNENSPLLS